MAFKTTILADSLAQNGKRLTTLELTLPRIILAELRTQRQNPCWESYAEFSYNAASSRAIPTEKIVQMVIDEPFIPEFRVNKKGMQAGEALNENDAELAKASWLCARDEAVERAREMHKWNIHKQYINRLLEPWMWCTVILSSTEWTNWFGLRAHKDAEPSFQRLAWMTWFAMRNSTPKLLEKGEWHLPMVDEADMDHCNWDTLKKISVGRCARVSYLTHDGTRDPQADIDLHDRLAKLGHWSPFEHQATPNNGERSGNFLGFDQYRKDFEGECIEKFEPTQEQIDEAYNEFMTVQ